MIYPMLLFALPTLGEARSAPYIQSFSPASGPAGTLVTIYGSGFTGTTSAGIGDSLTDIPFHVIKDTEIQLTIPSEVKTGQLNVTNPSGTSFDPSNFVVTHGSGSSSPSPTPKSSPPPKPTPSPTPPPTGGSGGCTNGDVVWAYDKYGKLPGWGDFNNTTPGKEGSAETDYTDTSGAPVTGIYDAKTKVLGLYGMWLYHAPATGLSTPQFGVNITACNFMYISLKEGAVPANWQIVAVLDEPRDEPSGVPPFYISNVETKSQGSGWVQYKVPLYQRINGVDYKDYLLKSTMTTWYKFVLQDQSGQTSNYWYAADIYFSSK